MSRRTRFGAAVGAALMAAALTAPAAAAGNDRVDVIVVYTDGVSNSSATTAAVARQHDVRPSHVYEHALEGFAGSVPEGRLNGLRNDPRVDYVELDQEVSIAAQSLPTGIERVRADDNGSIDIDSTDDVRIDVDVAVIDTGIDLDHPDLDVVDSTNCLNHSGGPPFSRTYFCDGTGDDGNGHGTHVAGTVGAIDNDFGVVGVAPGARLYGVKVLDDSGSGSWGSVAAGIDWVAAQGNIEVANLSLGGGESQAVDDALTALADSGVAIAVAAGNSDADVQGYGPAGHPDVLTVSALADYDGLAGELASPTCNDYGDDDTFATFSNFGDDDGDDVDIIAPGVCIESTVPGGYEDGWSGTSMASPHVAGGLALLASNTPNDANKDGTDVASEYSTLLTTHTNSDWLTSTDPDSSPDPLLDVSGITAATSGDSGGGGNSSPTSEFTFSCVELACDFDGSGSSDSDGSIASYDWDFGDGSIDSGMTVSHNYAEDGTYTVTLTVTDNEGATDTSSQDVAVSASTGGEEISLSATGYKVRGRHHVDLTWSGATSTDVDVYRDGTLLTTTANDGAYTDSTGNVGGATYTYQVCEAGTSTCSNEATVTL